MVATAAMGDAILMSPRCVGHTHTQGLIILSLLPAAFTMGYMRRLFPKSVLRSEMVLTFFLGMAWMSPLVVLENLAYYGVLTASTLEAQGGRQHSTEAITWGYHLLAAVVRVRERACGSLKYFKPLHRRIQRAGECADDPDRPTDRHGHTHTHRPT